MSNVHFTGEKDLEFRSGGDVDHTTLVTLFKLLGYNVHVLYDQTAQVHAAGKVTCKLGGLRFGLVLHSSCACWMFPTVVLLPAI